ncbi:MAG: hydantoinase B/oxoprolinase family protein, partial [Planctomycetota bacterium]
LLSAEGLRSAVLERFASREVLRPLEEVEATLEALVDDLGEEATEAVRSRAEGGQASVRRVVLRMRFSGQDSTLEVETRSDESAADAFLRRYGEVFGHLPGERSIELVSVRVVASTPPPEEVTSVEATTERSLPAADAHDLETLQPGDRLAGPALVSGPFGTTWLERGWSAVLDEGRTLRLSADESAETRAPRPASVDRELFTQRFEALAVEMGTMLRRTAVSTNVKERLDFSCALLDPGGRLVVNAPHVPVHLGSLGLCVRTVMDRTSPGDGDVIVVNHPAFGGSHLPDVTVLQPVHADDGSRLGWVANRAHHAELGGTRPGSMPPDATCLADEGVVLAPLKVVEAGEARWDRVEDALRHARHPTRRLGDNMADLRAAVAACRMGAEGLRALAAEHGADVVRDHMAGVLAHAAGQCRRALVDLEGREVSADDAMDDGTPIAVDLRVVGGRATIDFSRSGDVHGGNLNATPAIVRSAVLYSLRLLVNEPLPLNEGLMEPVDVVLRPGSLLDPPLPDDPSDCPAVVGGNVETSQRLVDVLLRGLGIAASSHGTMNNVTWGNETVSYYETVGGGCGATADGHGGSGMHSHMTNTRITDPEVLEHRYPVRLERFALRDGSGGDGAHRGGDGLVRETTFLVPMTLSLLTQRRTEGPPGLDGGAPGSPGAQRIECADGTIVPLDSLAGVDVEPGDRLVLETPGGGGCGEPA